MFLSVNPYLFIAIGVIVGLILLFFITYFANKKTPLPKGCEGMEISEDNCFACGNYECRIHKKIDLKKIEEEIKEDKE